MKKIILHRRLVFAFIILHIIFNVEMNAQSSFNFKKYLFDSLSTLSLFVDSINSGTGYVNINGVDSRALSAPFNWYWGDGNYSSGFFPLSHTYENTEINYVVKVIANYSSGWKDTAESLIRFVPPSISPVTLSDTISVIIPDHDISLDSRPFLGYEPPSLAFFDNSFFTTIPRSSLEYILSAAADIQMDFVNHDSYLFEDKFEQYMLRDSLFGGAYSLWFSDPVAFGVGDVFMRGSIGYSSLFHEMGHNFTLNTPGAFFWGGWIGGNANAIFSETMAQIFQHATGYELVNTYLDYGLSEDIMFDIKQQVIQTIKFVRLKYEEYCNSGYPYSSWNEPSTEDDETFLTFMTIAYKFFEHAENSGSGYLIPLKRMMTFLQGFCQNWADSYDHNNNTAVADSFRATLFVRALSDAFQTDLRTEFRSLHFPVSNQIYNTLPVELENFTASVTKSNSVRIKWKTITEVNNYGFEIEKQMNLSPPEHYEPGKWKKIGFVGGHGNSNTPINYSYTDLNPGFGKIAYRLKQIDNDGKYIYSNIAEVFLESLGIFDLSQNYPNPFNPNTTIKYSIPKQSIVSLKVYDLLGKEILTLVNENKPMGNYTVEFKSENISGGVYFYKLSSGQFSQVKKMLLLK
jgi:hypothetical protein